MDAREVSLIEELAPENRDLSEAYDEHRRLKALVDKLGTNTHASADDDLRRRELQKRKLVLKDKMMRIIEEYRQSA